MRNEELPNNQMLQDAYIAKLSGIAEYKNEKEIWWENTIGERITIEFVDDIVTDAIVRRYYSNSKHWECSITDGIIYGLRIWNLDGNVVWEQHHINVKKILGEEMYRQII
jgi:hypothetical protein